MPRIFFGMLIAIALGGAYPATAQDRVLNIYNWSDYIAEDTIARFEEETGIQVVYDVFDSNEVLETKLLAGRTGYDIVVPSGSFLERQIQAGVFQKLNRDKLTNYENLDPVLLARVAGHDPDNAYAVPYLWGTTGIGYNPAMIAERLGPDYEVTSWEVLFNPEIAAKLADCGIYMLDAPSEVVEIALNYLGLDPISERRRDYRRAERLLQSVRPYVSKFTSSAYIEALANGDICLALGWSGDVIQASDRATEANNNVEVAYTIPSEGTVVWFDLMAIPADAGNVEEAHEFINFVLRPEIIADITNYVAFANANRNSLSLVDPEVRADSSIYPDSEVQARLFPDKNVSPRTERVRTRLWQRVTTGN